MINREKLDELIEKQIDNSFTSVEDVIDVFENNEEYKKHIKDIYLSVIHEEWNDDMEYRFEIDFKYQAEIAVNKYERDELLKDGVESLLKSYKDDIAHLVINIREMFNALLQANAIIKQQAEEIERLEDNINDLYLTYEPELADKETK